MVRPIKCPMEHICPPTIYLCLWEGRVAAGILRYWEIFFYTSFKPCYLAVHLRCVLPRKRKKCHSESQKFSIHVSLRTIRVILSVCVFGFVLHCQRKSFISFAMQHWISTNLIHYQLLHFVCFITSFKHNALGTAHAFALPNQISISCRETKHDDS